MIDRVATWTGEQFARLMAWFEHLDGWLQFVIIVCVALVIVGLTHLDDLAREREWRQFRLWLERRRRAGVLRLPKGMR